MSWRTVVISSRAKLDLKLNYMVVRGDEVKRIHLSEISTVVIESTAVSLTAALLCELMKRKIKVIFCDEKRNPSSELIPYYGSHDDSGRIREQLHWDKAVKDMVWTEIAAEKIRKQAEFLEELGHDGSVMLRRYIDEMAPADETNREGHAAKVYFNAVFGMDFTRTENSSVNAALNYGYGIILSAFNREIAASGYLTQLGLNHSNQYNHFNLSSDLMEPFRILVDRKVYEMQPDVFTHEEKMEMLSVLNRSVVIGGKHQYVSNAAGIYCRSVFSALNEKDISQIRFYENEL